MPHTKDLSISCTRCTTPVSLGQTTYDSSGRNLICFNCYNKIAKGEEPEKIIQSASIPARIDYNCFSCGFKFSRSVAFHFTGICFNCGKQTVRTEKQEHVVMRDRKNLLDY